MTNDRHDDGRDPAGTGAPLEWLEAVRETYNTPPEAPREEMWTAIRAGMAGSDEVGSATDGMHEHDHRVTGPSFGFEQVRLQRHHVHGPGVGVLELGLFGKRHHVGNAAVCECVGHAIFPGVGVSRQRRPTG